MSEKRPTGCCGVCPPIKGGGYDCTCEGNPRCVEAVGGEFIKFDMNWGMIPPGLGYETKE